MSCKKCTFYFQLRVFKLSERRSSPELVVRAYLERHQSVSTDKDLDNREVRNKEILQMNETF